MKWRLTSLAGLLVLGGCAALLGSRNSPEAILQAADARLDRMAFEKLIVFQGPQLFNYMDGAAEAYFSHGFLEMATADTRWRSTDAKVELYRLKDPASAAALFDNFNDGKGKELPAGLASAAWKAKELEGIFHRGPFFCRLIIYGADREAEVLLDTLSAAIDQAIPE